jgi:hypothetical protein
MDAASMSRALPPMKSGEKNSAGEKPEDPLRQNGMQFGYAGLNPNKRRMRVVFGLRLIGAQAWRTEYRGLNTPAGKQCACGGPGLFCIWGYGTDRPGGYNY